VPVPEHSTTSRDVYGYVKPGTMTALMVQAALARPRAWTFLLRGRISCRYGDFLVDGRPLDSDFARGTAYGEVCFLPPPSDVHRS